MKKNVRILWLLAAALYQAKSNANIFSNAFDSLNALTQKTASTLSFADATNSLDKPVSIFRTAYKTSFPNSFTAAQNTYQLPAYVPDALKTVLQNNCDLYASKNNTSLTEVMSEQTSCADEENFINSRLAYTGACLDSMFARTSKDSKSGIESLNMKHHWGDSPRVAVCASGGGFRAMIATLGFWQGMRDTGLDDTVLMTSCLSGSTWFTTPWALGKDLAQLEATYKKYAVIPVGATATVSTLKNNLLAFPQSAPFAHNLFPEKKVVNDNFMRAFYFSFPYNLVQAYSTLVGHMTLAAFDDPTLLVAQDYEKTGGTVDITNKHIQSPTLAPYYGPDAIQSRQTVFLSQAAEYLNNQTTKYGNNSYMQRPMPIATSVTAYKGTWFTSAAKIAQQQQSFDGYQWIEYTPYSVSLDYYHKNKLCRNWISTKLLGKKFEGVTSKGTAVASWWNPKSWVNSGTTHHYGAVNDAPEYTLGFLQGIWGSAFAISPSFLMAANNFDATDSDVQTPSDKNAPSQSKIMSLLSAAFSKGITLLSSLTSVAVQVSPLARYVGTYKDFRLFPAVINNFAILPGSPFSDDPNLTTVDAGISCNLPFPPLLRSDRKIDIIIAVDASSDVSDGSGNLSSLTRAEAYARAKGLPFPKIANSEKIKGASARAFTVFDEFEGGATGPVVIYMPLTTDSDGKIKMCNNNFDLQTCVKKGACSTFNFSYTPEDVDNLANQMRCAVHLAADGIKTELKKVMARNLRRISNSYFSGTPEDYTGITADDIVDLSSDVSVAA